jgi:RHS repeat-associated protein
VAYVIDPNAALSRTLMRGTGESTTYYIWGATGLEYEISGGSAKTYHADHLGSTMLLTNASGSPTGEYFEYDAYGTPTHTAGSPATPFRWHGTLGVTTEANGLLHMRARYYHPRLMRFLNQDPIGFEGGMNWFAFVGNNPINSVDPTGLQAFEDYNNRQNLDYWRRASGINTNDLEQVARADANARRWAAGIVFTPFVVTGGIAAAPTVGAAGSAFLTQAPTVIITEVAATAKATQIVAQRAPELVRSVGQFGSAMNQAAIEIQAMAVSRAPFIINASLGVQEFLKNGTPGIPDVSFTGRAGAAGVLYGYQNQILGAIGSVLKNTAEFFGDKNMQSPYIPGSAFLTVPNPGIANGEKKNK